ncbi:right-handed parallel beta-helix repeat-containing protein, partial [Thermanaerothrix sp.]|uniref:right-handed parallel beta-helix repeat-containing protein n=1 Tax=Thermanaerothrix sp. TaxID=2972675 RepID=UPI003C7BCCEB
ITKKLTLLSTEGREQTTIQGISGEGALGTILISNNTDGVQIGDIGHGFKIIGIDNGYPEVENAAIYFQGNHSNAVIKGNEIVANGEHGLLTEYSAIITGFLIDSNVFSGKTFQGDKPAGNGFGQQFTLPNVPRQLVVMGGGASGTGTTNITFTNNRIIGTAGGFNDEGQPQGNTLVTLDAENSRIEGNVFEGVTSRDATSLRVRRSNVSIKNNVFKSTGLLSPATGHLYLLNNPINDSLIADNTFDKGVYIENLTGGTIGTNVSLFATAAPTNSVIHVLPGTYEEQVVVSGKTLTLQGEGDDPADVVIKSPTTLSAKFTTSVDNKPVVLVQNNANVTIKNLTVDGAKRGGIHTNYRFMGIAFYNAGGTVENVTVTGVRDDENGQISGMQHGLGIYAYNQDGTTRTLTVRNTTVTDFQKNGITVVGSGLTATIEGNTITGAGSTSIIAQNGIQVSYGAAATVRHNTVSGIAYRGQNWVAAGILVLDAGTTTVEGNTLTSTQANIYVVESSATVSANRISAPACVGDACYGIIASDPLSARPSPLEEAVASTTPAQPNRSNNFTLLGSTNPLDTVTITANEISGATYASGESVGLGVYDGYADRDVAVSASQNVISGWSYGVYVGRCDPEVVTCYSGRLRTFALNQNAITENAVGMGTNLTISLNAERNWWGSAHGPQVATNAGGDGQPIEGSTIDYVPWLCDGTDAQPSQIGFQPVSNAETCTNTPTRLRFIVQPPSTAFTNEPFDPQPQVRVEDAQGNLAINYDNAILIALANNPAGGVLGGTLSADPVNGVATFTNLFLNKPGPNYRLLATSGTLTAAYSNYFTVVDPSADLGLNLSVPGSVNAGATFDYTLTVSNAGPKAANALTLTLNLPAGVTYQSASGSGWTCNYSAGTVTCTATSLASGANTTVTVNVTAPAQAGTLTATASVRADSPTDPNSANNSASADTTVVVLPPTGGSQIFLPLIMR